MHVKKNVFKKRCETELKNSDQWQPCEEGTARLLGNYKECTLIEYDSL